VTTATPPDHADLLIEGRVATLVGEEGWAWQSGLAIAGGRIVGAGSLHDLESFVGPGTRRVRIPADQIVLPGITDAHLHLMTVVLAESQIDVTGLDLDATLAAIATEHQSRSAAGDTDRWLLGHGWSKHALGVWPDVDMLERVAPGRPVALYAHDHHARWVSSAAIRIAGIDRARGDEAVELVRRDERGAPSGVLHEGAAALVDAAIPDPAHEELVAALKVVATRLASLGVTGCHDPGELNDDRVMKRGPLFYRDLAARDALALRVHGSIRAPQLDHALKIAWRSGESVGRYTSGWLKLFSDGSLGSRSAALIDAYLDADTNPPTGGPTGMVVTDANELRYLLLKAAQAGIVGQVHAIGDGAVRTALDVYADIPDVDTPLMRRIEHAQLVDPADQRRFGPLGVAASVQPVHLRSDANQERAAWGLRAEQSFPLRGLLDGGALIPFGTDAPVEPLDPWPGIAVAMARRDPFAPDDVPLGIDHAISVERAVRATCLDPALVAGRTDLGRLFPGYLADLIVISDIVARDGPDAAELASVRPSATLIDGVLVHGDL